MRLGNVTDLVVDVTDKPMDLPIEILKFHVHELVEWWDENGTNIGSTGKPGD